MRIAIGADHGGVALKDAVARRLVARGVTVTDHGCRDSVSVDYPDFALAVTDDVAADADALGVLVCTTGIGMSMAANKRPGIRAALCLTTEMARLSRSHNAANVLVLGGALQPEAEALALLDAWLETPFSGGARHARRIAKIQAQESVADGLGELARTDPELAAAVRHENARQSATLNLIASENTVSRAVCEAQGSLLTNKYAEGYPGRRWYSGCAFVDRAEELAIERACALFGADRANVQPHAGSSANMAVYMSMLKPGDTILAMSLADGGHLTHGSPVNFSGQLYTIVPYGVDRDTELIDYDAIQSLAEQHRPKLIVAGASAYPRTLDFDRFRAIADAVGARLMVDMAHIAGLVAGGAHPNPVPVADYVTSTTHKTLRGPRSGFVLCREAYGRDIDKTVFPGLQGGPLMHVIAAKAVCFKEAMDPAFKTYAAAVVRHAQVMADVFRDGGIRLVSGGTDNHLMLLDVAGAGTTGKAAAAALDAAGIIVNKNAIPFDTQSPFVTSGIRIGTPGVTSRGMNVDDMRRIAAWILDVIRRPEDEGLQQRIRADVAALCRRHPVL